jgi:acetate kinase
MLIANWLGQMLPYQEVHRFLCMVLNGLDAIVFTAGIGENSSYPEISV